MTANYTSIRLSADPIQSLLTWLQEAEQASVPEPTAMTLATATKDGLPDARIVLFKGISTGREGRPGLQFFTNYTSPKSRQMEANPQATLVFYWASQFRQVRISGRIEKMSPEESNAYFQTRPRESRIGAWTSPQSQRISGRDQLLTAYKEEEMKFEGKEIPCPPFWGGWRLVPEKVEFWQAVDFRLHDRFHYEWQNGNWEVSRLAP